MAGRLSRTACGALAAGLGLMSTALPFTARADLQTASRYTELPSPGCVRIAPKAYRCPGWEQIDAWLAAAGPRQARLGFGERRNVSGVFELERGRRWCVEWRGAEVAGRFEPFAAIVRVCGARKSRLVVYHLRPDGTSCIVGETQANPAARALADSTRDTFTCEAPFDVP